MRIKTRKSLCEHFTYIFRNVLTLSLSLLCKKRVLLCTLQKSHAKIGGENFFLQSKLLSSPVLTLFLSDEGQKKRDRRLQLYIFLFFTSLDVHFAMQNVRGRCYCPFCKQNVSYAKCTSILLRKMLVCKMKAWRDRRLQALPGGKCKACKMLACFALQKCDGLWLHFAMQNVSPLAKGKSRLRP